MSNNYKFGTNGKPYGATKHSLAYKVTILTAALSIWIAVAAAAVLVG